MVEIKGKEDSDNKMKTLSIIKRKDYVNFNQQHSGLKRMPREFRKDLALFPDE
jgi:hypothetical protein